MVRGYREPKPLAQRVLEGSVVKENGCREWTGTLDAKGYGIMNTGSRTDGTRKTKRVHIVAYELAVGPVPDGLVLDHECHNLDLACDGGNTCPHRRCCEPSHLVPRTKGDNSRAAGDRIGRGGRAAMLAKTHCPKGHPYEGDNLLYGSNGQRLCRICRNETARQFRERNPGYRQRWPKWKVTPPSDPTG